MILKIIKCIVNIIVNNTKLTLSFTNSLNSKNNILSKYKSNINNFKTLYH